MHLVLVVDDYEDTRELLRFVLSERGYRVLTASDGEEGIRIAFEARPHAVIMDMYMPGMDGLQATEQLKQDPRTASTPVIAYTARPTPLEHKQHLFARICGKPCSPDILLGMLRDVLAA